jgi:hypothetical protein
MKIILRTFCILSLFSFFHLSIHKVNAQKYYFMNDSATWKVDFFGYSIDCLGHCYEWEYNITGDTIINSNAFKKLHEYYHTIWNQQYYGQNAGAIREDTADKKVYYRSFTLNDTIEHLLYDFDLNVGDTLLSTYLYPTGPFPVVDSIDYVLIANENHKRFWFTNGAIAPAYLLEGVGSRYGLLDPLYGSSEGGNSLTCFEVGEDFLFSAYDTAYYGCHIDIPLAIENLNSNSSIQIFSNPNDDLLTVKNSTGGKISILLFDELGRVHFLQSSSVSKFLFSTSSLAAGIYFVHCTDEAGNTLLTEKILVE